MKIVVLLLALWAIAATKAGLIKKAVVPPPVTTATAPKPPVPAAPATATAPAAPSAPAAPAAPATSKAPAVVAPADLVASKYKVSFKLANVKFADGLTSYDSAVYQNYAGKIETGLMNLYADDNAYREMKMIGFRNETGVIADVSLRFANDSKNLASLDALLKTGTLGDLPVDPASLQAVKDESLPPVAMPMGYGCGQPCNAPQQCYPSCSSSCCGSTGASSYMPPMTGQFGGAPMPPMPMPTMPFPPMPMTGGAGQCPGQCPSSCAPSCQQSCCGGAGSQMNPMLG